jgi:DNA-binding IclR family transcriptional regulator
LRLSVVAQRTGLHKATVHRMLAALMRQGWVERDAATRTYFFGAELRTIAWSAATRFDLRAEAKPSMRRLAGETGDTALRCVPIGYDSLCIDREEGSFPTKTLSLAVGMRRPLGVGAVSLALLAAFDDATAEEAIQANPLPPGFSPDILRMLVAETRAQGFAFNGGRVALGMSAVGVAARTPRGEPFAAFSVAAITERMGPDRRAAIVDMLRREAAVIEALLRPCGEETQGQEIL